MPKKNLYSRAHETQTADGNRIGQYPEFELAYLFDVVDNPREVTIFNAGWNADLSTEWLTADVGTAVPLEEVR